MGRWEWPMGGLPLSGCKQQLIGNSKATPGALAYATLGIRTGCRRRVIGPGHAITQCTAISCETATYH